MAPFMTRLLVLASLFLLIPTVFAEKPNIILVMADDQGWGDMAYQGHPLLKTPHFDKAAAEGLRFDRFYAAAPVCSPTRASVMSGRHPNRSACYQWGHKLRPQEISIAEALQTAGYKSGHFGKWHLGSVRKGSPVSPGAQGFDEWLSAPNFYDNDPILSHKGEAVALKGESSMVAADAAIDWMKQQTEAEQPFLAVVWFGSPHHPHEASQENFDLYADHPEAYPHFLGEVTGMDTAFGKIRDSLTELGIRDNTILWYCSDNGALPKEGSAGDFRGKKGDCYEGGVLVPAILEWPNKITKPRQTSLRANTCDIYPTLLEIVGVEMPNQPKLDGLSLVPIIEDRESDMPHRAMGFWDYDIRGIGMKAYDLMEEVLKAQQAGEELPVQDDSLNAAKILTPHAPGDYKGHAAWNEDDWKLHRLTNKKGDVTYALYNLKADPYEKNDLSQQEPERAANYQKRLESWMDTVIASSNGADYTN